MTRSQLPYTPPEHRDRGNIWGGLESGCGGGGSSPRTLLQPQVCAGEYIELVYFPAMGSLVTDQSLQSNQAWPSDISTAIGTGYVYDAHDMTDIPWIFSMDTLRATGS
ncbi:hypothetical protein SNK03_010271 [Fusarium graminearum]|uniref:Chromosome 4, complete genome n=2 Tax=Gibberella zeae TaxID=5518 RepID=I1S9J1_GIBZE|nr:hypothetical protein FGSG_13522 [Fusarium graminearum PH-1]EYB26916.1 hypothetical protein FG05_13522 [Fusarium graminearum]ESU15691.1 hypothetical protein FGSG_13522 [Fusarium graminearum PH-1]CAF3475351.1 unnamed protein product [Fusarium graminearum]CAF3623899.1 unnamed protein product [Fusarium graminearum]CAF3644613.1 unnamed protein product [Fusarium graminearum]|eukprot:XP_011328625.1 hypothetical protein FGSG_13522 [Fusarium graminearum PH-1]